jgi:tetraacyldisaccharide 4'-kinase
MKEILQKMNKWPRIWDDDGSSSRYNPVKTILYILSLVYLIIINLRNWLYDNKIIQVVKLPCPVISVGNITVGGTGKTPCVIWLAEMLRENGFKPAILSRGYGGKNSLPVNIVSDGKDILLSSAAAGDEPCLIAQTLKGVPVITGPQRILTGQTAINNFGTDVLICDDAFQHRQIFRDINLLLLDSQRPLGNGHVLPRGSLREPARELHRANAFIVTRVAEAAKPGNRIGKLAQEMNMPVFFSSHKPVDIVQGDYSIQLPLADLKGKKICAFAGIAKPDSFKKSILAAEAQIISFDIFPDHHRYNKNELNRIHNNFLNSDADLLITTEKDGMRLWEFTEFLPLIYLMRMALEIVPDKKPLENFILEKLGKTRLKTEDSKTGACQ